MLAQLVVISGADRGRTISLSEGQTLVLGRGESASAQLNDPHVSRTHCQIEVDGGVFRLTDNASRGGTFVGGKQVDKHELRPGEVIRLGDTELRFQLGTPANILVRSSDKVAKLGDLMLAKALTGTLARQVTQLGELVGDVLYMSPERTRSDAEVDGRSDIYGLGVTVYALLTGRPPFEGNSLPEVVSKIRQEEPEKPKKYQLSIPDLLEDLVLRMIAKRPEERPQSAKDLVKELERIGRYQGIKV